MSRRIEQQNEFLRLMLTISKNNPELQITSKLVYANFEYDGKHNNIEHFFDSWSSYFEDKENITVKRSDTHKYFCTFNNFKNNIKNKDHIKMYISYDAEHIYRNATLIFEFLEKNDISHTSKIASFTRKDSIVIRLGNTFDAKLLANFINSVPELSEGRTGNTPFTFNENGIAYAVDYHMSFNSVASELISEYINNISNTLSLEDGLSKINVSDLQNFIKEKLNELQEKKPGSLNGVLNKAEIMQLLINFLNEEYTLDEYFQDYKKREYSKNKSINEKIEHLNNLTQETMKEEENNLREAKENFVTPYGKIINTMINKYGYLNTCKAFKKYLIDGNVSSFTRDNNIRAMMASVDFKAFKDYFIYLYSDVDLENIFSFINGYLDLTTLSIKKALNVTENKYSEAQAIGAVKKVITENSLKSFTNEDNSRIVLEDLSVDKTTLNIIVAYLNQENLEQISDYSGLMSCRQIKTILQNNVRQSS